MRIGAFLRQREKLRWDRTDSPKLIRDCLGDFQNQRGSLKVLLGWHGLVLVGTVVLNRQCVALHVEGVLW